MTSYAVEPDGDGEEALWRIDDGREHAPVHIISAYRIKDQVVWDALKAWAEST